MYIVGLGGEGYCSNRSHVGATKADVEVTFLVNHPDGKPPYEIIKGFCAEHRAHYDTIARHYPTHTIVKEVKL